MKFVLQLKNSIYNFMRSCGYHQDRWNEKPGQMVFIKKLGFNDYPRFHIYAETSVSRETLRLGSGQAIINLHLDQKKPVYKGAAAHSGEYEGELIEKEAKRIQKMSR